MQGNLSVCSYTKELFPNIIALLLFLPPVNCCPPLNQAEKHGCTLQMPKWRDFSNSHPDLSQVRPFGIQSLRSDKRCDSWIMKGYWHYKIIEMSKFTKKREAVAGIDIRFTKLNKSHGILKPFYSCCLIRRKTNHR